MITILLFCQVFSPSYLTTVNLNNCLTFKLFLTYGSLSTSVKLDRLLTLGVCVCFSLLVIDICVKWIFNCVIVASSRQNDRIPNSDCLFFGGRGVIQYLIIPSEHVDKYINKKVWSHNTKL